jgi:hypothetical protein
MARWLLVAAAGTCTGSGIALLYRSWLRRPQGSRPAAAGWLLLVVAAAWWIALDGWEFGLIYSITVPSLAAGIALWIVADRRPGRVAPAVHLAISRPSWSAVRENLVTFFLVVPFGVMASTLVTTAAGLLLPFGDLDQVVFIVCAVPVVWGVVACWLTIDAHRLRPVLSLAALSGASLLTILR